MTARLALLLFVSGAAALTCEVVWMRRLALVAGSSALATTLVLSLYMAGLGAGGALGGRWRWRQAPRGYGRLELAAAAWAVCFPWLADQVADLPVGLAAALLLIPPGLLHGATLPAAAAATSGPRDAGLLYATNTAGAVLGTLLAPWLWMPLLGVRGAELVAAAAAAGVGLVALALEGVTAHAPSSPAPAGRGTWLAAATAGLVAMALEVTWARLGALLLGGSVYAFAMVLAVFLAGVALGAAWGRRLGVAAAAPALLALGALAALGTAAWRILPYALALGYEHWGAGALLPLGAVLLALAMAGAPVASGVVFAACLHGAGGSTSAAAGRVLLANTAGGVVGAATAGLWALPALGIRGTALALATLGVATALALTRRRATWLLGVGALALAWLLPGWDRGLYAVGLYARLDQFADLSPRAVAAFAHDGWRPLFYEDGRTATVVVGESTRTGRRWLSINGKVDASDGRDMPTQQLSGQIPVLVAGGRPEVLVVGLASGVTAATALAGGAHAVTVVELEPAVVRASAAFEHVNGRVLADPRTTLVVDDARAVLRRATRQWDVIVSEPSNPWLTGVSNLFTREYWSLAQGRLAPGGVFCQWVQLYSLPPTAFRSLVRTFLDVFPRAWLFETIPGADALLVATRGELPPDLPLAPTLGPEDLARLAGVDTPFAARLNTDDRPWIEFEAPRWLLRDTASANEALIRRGGE